MSKNKTFDLSTLKGYPNNPRTALTEKGREKLGKSLQKNGKFLALREIIYDPETMEILGGNKRFELLVEQGFKDVPIEWVKAASGLTEQEKREFVLLDNSHYETEFDYEIIQQYFSDINLDDICIIIPNFTNGHEANDMNENELDLTEEFDPIGSATNLHKVIFIFDNEIDAGKYFDEKIKGLVYKKFGGGQGKQWQINLSTTYGK